MRWKWALGIIALSLVTLVVTAYLILVSYDYNKLKPRIAQAVRDATGRELTLGGAVELAVGLSPSLVVANVMFANAPWATQPQMMKAERLEVQVRLLPLLFGDAALEGIALIGMEVLLETDAQGKGNWEFKTGEKSTESFWTLKELQIENVKIVKLNLTFHDGQSGSTSRFTLDSLDASRKPSSDEITIDLKGTANKQPFALSGKTGLIDDLLAHKPLEVDLLGQVSGANITVAGVIGDVLELDGIDLKIHASGTDLAGLGRVAGTELLETDAFKMGGEVKGSAKALALQDFKGNASRGSIECTINGKVDDLISVTGVDLEVKGSGKDLADVSPIVDKKLPTTGPFTVTGRLTGSSKALSLQAVEGSVSRDSLRLTVNGKIEDLLALSGIAFNVKGSGKELAEIGPLLEKKLPKFGSFDVGGNLTGSTKVLALDGLSVIVGKSDFIGSAKVEFHQRPKITLALESGLIDFTPLIGEAKKEDKRVGKKGEYDKRLFPDDPLPFEVLKKVDADIVLRAKNMKAREAQFDLGHLTLTLKDNDLSIDKLEAIYKGTKLSGYVHLYPGSPPQVVTKFLVQGFDLGRYLREIGASDKAEGYIDIAADLKSKGYSAHTLVANLDGAIGLVMGRGYLSHWLNLFAINLSKEVIPFWGRHKEAQNIICAAVDFDIKSGIATSRTSVFDTEIAVLNAEGDINLETEQVDFLLSPKPKSAGLTLLNTKLRVTGSIQDPKVRPDYTSVVLTGSRALSALVVGPLGLLAPFVSLGAHEKHPCDVKKLGNNHH
ncbi:MAG: AsmA family protein [Deltaproteobacteria bacterium]|nr:AsmA family protein [Deltaproteobacteria bacterium]